jgi:hypothetical protein
MAHLLKRAGGGGAAADPLFDPNSRGVGLDVKQYRQEGKVPARGTRNIRNQLR